MSREEFEKNLHIAYIDEVELYSAPNVSLKAIVSLIVKKNYYINNIENEWYNLRNKYNFPNGYCIHFVEIKKMLNPNVKNIDPVLKKIFYNGEDLNVDKLFEFYEEIFKIIDKKDFRIIVTVKEFKKNAKLSNKDIKKYLNTEWYILFKEHLDDLAGYLLNKSYSSYKHDPSKNKKIKLFNTKLRYDGDFGLTSKDDLRDAYAHAITNGTKNFSSDLIKKCFSSLKFVDKKEVGFYSEDTKYKLISHAGSELLDFIALYAGKIVLKDILINYYKKTKLTENSEITEEEAEKQANLFYKKSLNIYKEGRCISPMSCINKKIVVNNFFK